MATASSVSFIIPIILLTLALLIIGQHFILRCKNKRLGMILPFIWFCISLIITFYNVCEHNDKVILTIFAFLVLNIPTGIMLLMMYIKNGKEKVSENN